MTKDYDIVDLVSQQRLRRNGNTILRKDVPNILRAVSTLPHWDMENEWDLEAWKPTTPLPTRGLPQEVHQSISAHPSPPQNCPPASLADY